LLPLLLGCSARSLPEGQVSWSAVSLPHGGGRMGLPVPALSFGTAASAASVGSCSGGICHVELEFRVEAPMEA